MADALTHARRTTAARTWAAVVLVAALAVAGSRTPVAAHEADQRVRSVVTEVTIDVPGLVVEVGRSVADQLLVSNPSDVEVEILDGDGRAFLRIGPDGVLGDLETAAFHLSNDPFGVGRVPPEADGGPARWGRLSREPAWGWFDHRLHPEQRVAPADAEAGDVLARWAVPVRAGEREGEIRGQVEFRPLLGRYRASLDQDLALPDAVTAAVLDGPVPAVTLGYVGNGTVLVLGADGEPFLRVGADGVDANLRSPSWHDVARLEAGRAIPDEPPDARAAPRWMRIAEVGQVTWLELRAHVADEPPEEPGREVVASRWTVPLRVDDADHELRGTTRWVPAADGDTGSGPLVPIVGLLIVLAGAAVIARRRGGASGVDGGASRARGS